MMKRVIVFIGTPKILITIILTSPRVFDEPQFGYVLTNFFGVGVLFGQSLL